MTDTLLNFAIDRLNAARAFAHTMILVDDEANSDVSRYEKVTSDIQEPERRTKLSTKLKKTDINVSHPLNSNIVVENALELGLVCAIVQPGKRDHVINKVSKAAERADIISLDWRMHSDDGDIAKSIIRKIVQKDSRSGGRLRLIAIYTGVIDQDRICKSILSSIPKIMREQYNIRETDKCIVSDHGLRIVCLQKGGGVRRAKLQTVEEKDLPERLLVEFSNLSTGLLSNVALVTIAAVRNSTHHVLGKFTGTMDGPYFHHRAILENPTNAEDYAVSVVLSELKGAVDKQEIAAAAAGREAIGNRIRNMVGDTSKSKKLFRKDQKDEKEIPIESIVSITCDGWNISSNDKKIEEMSLGRANIRKGFSGLFDKSYQVGRSNMMAFASLTGVQSHSSSYLHGKAPRLNLGSVITADQNKYLLCLQATCDTVRVKDNHQFYFVPLIEEEEMPEHVVPIPIPGNIQKYLGLSVEERAYSKAISLKFSPNSEGEGSTVRATKISGKSGYYFTDVDDKAYEWIANLKQRRALRSTQWVGQEMSRIGFDEFDAFRPETKPKT